MGIIRKLFPILKNMSNSEIIGVFWRFKINKKECKSLNDTVSRYHIIILYHNTISITSIYDICSTLPIFCPEPGHLYPMGCVGSGLIPEIGTFE